MGTELALLRRFPGLAALPRVPFLEVPTPVEPVRGAGIPEGSLYVKRDDRSCPVYGGNKPRKLEFVIGAAARRGSRRLVTTGGWGTHHGLATALLGRSQGMASTLVLVPQPVTAHVRRQLLAMVASGARLRSARGVPGAAVEVSLALAAAQLRGERPTLVPTGGSSALGNAGFVSAVFELVEQIESGILPQPGEILVPVGSGGTIAGLVLGARLTGLATRIVGVMVTDILPPSPARLARLARATLQRLRRTDPSLPEVLIREQDFELVHTQLGAGYGAPTEAGRTACRRMQEAGLELENVYTGKCMAEILERIESGSLRRPVLFWNTFNSVPLATSPSIRAIAALPRPLRRVLADTEETLSR